MNVAICCPSYRRPKVKSFDFYGDLLKVYVDCGEYDEYVKNNPEYKDCIISVPDGVQGNVARIRNYILNDCLVNQEYDVCCIVDDDMDYIVYYEGLKLHKLNKDEIIPFVEKYTTMCDDLGYKMWGINLNNDPQCYREYSPFSTLSVFLGPLCCYLKGNKCRYDEDCI